MDSLESLVPHLNDQYPMDPQQRVGKSVDGASCEKFLEIQIFLKVDLIES
jgi:hypothetical protein